MTWLARHLERRVQQLFEQFSVVYINGPRRAGKTVLVHELLAPTIEGQYHSLDRLSERQLAHEAPHTYVSGLELPVILDEVQRVPDLFLAIKERVDQTHLDAKKQVPGQFLLTGSANLVAMPALANALVGRMASATLLPLSGAEVLGHQGSVVHRLFDGDLTGWKPGSLSLLDVMRQATFPDAMNLEQEALSWWCDQYIEQVTLYDPQLIYRLDKAASMPRLLKLLVDRVGQTLEFSSLSRDVQLSMSTVKQYTALLEQMFVMFSLKPWYHHQAKRVVKTPKIYGVDVVLMSQLLNTTLDTLMQQDRSRFGQFLENFVLLELMKSAIQQGMPVDFYFYRTHEGDEVDVVMEHRGDVVGVEVKLSERIHPGMLKGLRALQSIAGDRFVCGVVLCQVPRVMPLGDGLYAVPLSALWQF